MKTKVIKILGLAVASFGIVSCSPTDEGPSIGDHFLNYVESNSKCKITQRN